MLGKRSDQRGLFEADHLYLAHVGKDSFYGFLASQRGELFRIRHWHRIRQRIGRAELRFHDLRHGCATIWLAAGEHIKVVQELLGHHSVTMTVDLYGHVVPSAHREAATRIGRLLGGAAV